MLNGYLNYFAVPGNDKSLWWFCNEIRWRWLKTLRRRSQTARFDWDRFVRITNRFFPPIRVRHPMPCHRFDATIRGKRSYAGAAGWVIPVRCNPTTTP